MSPTEAVILYLVFALGGVGIYLAMPGERRSARTAGLLFGLAAVAGFVALAAGKLSQADGTLSFCVLAAAAVFCAGKVVTHRKPVYSALYFILVVVSVACLMVVQEAEFLGIALIIVYAGAILVTYVFVIMLAQQSGASATDTRAREPLTAVLVGFVTMAAVAGRASEGPPAGVLPSASPAARLVAATASSATAEPEADHDALAGSNTAQVGLSLLTRYVMALEIAGVLLLVAMVGAVALAKRRVPRDVPVAPAPPLGEIGRQVPPF